MSEASHTPLRFFHAGDGRDDPMGRERLIEELRIANDRLTQMNRNLQRSFEMAQQFVDNVSHEFRTPLTVIKEFTWLMREQLAGPITEQQARYLDTVLNRTDDLALMVDDMLDASKLKAGLLGVDRRCHELSSVIEQSVNIVERRAAAKKLRVRTEVAADLPAVFCDEEKVRRVILNLLVNAIKFTPESGEITIWARTEAARDDAAEVAGERTNLLSAGTRYPDPPGAGSAAARIVRIGVTDTGPGISKQDQQAIFRRFHQLDANPTATRHSHPEGTRPPASPGGYPGRRPERLGAEVAEGAGSPSPSRSARGFGLGLDIARELVDLNLGAIDLESEPGQGSTFSFTLPTTAPEVLADVFLHRAAAYRGAPAVAILDVRSTGRHRTSAANQGRCPGPTSGRCPAAAPYLHEFLAEHIGGNDLLLSCSPSRWLILTTRDPQQVDELCAAVEAARADFNRNSPRAHLAPISIRSVRTGCLPQDRQRIADAFCHMSRAAGAEKPTPRQVLIVDDDCEVAEALGVRLAGAGYRVLTARDGQEGIESAVLHRPDAVLLDIRMPGKDGMTALSELRTHPDTKSLPIIMLSASVRDQQAALDDGARFFIQKPYDAQTVLSALQASMETRDEPEESAAQGR